MVSQVGNFSPIPDALLSVYLDRPWLLSGARGGS